MKKERYIKGFVLVGLIGISISNLSLIADYLHTSKPKKIDFSKSSCNDVLVANEGDRIKISDTKFVDILSDGIQVHQQGISEGMSVDIHNGEVISDSIEGVRSWKTTSTVTSRVERTASVLGRWNTVIVSFDPLMNRTTLEVRCN